MLSFYKESDFLRPLHLQKDGALSEPYRSDFYRDYARLIHSPAFRRLQGKTQLFPGHESDFFRNRLTHSMEVAQIGKAITNRINYLISRELDVESKQFIDPDLVQMACLAHDLGHPPFGHQGEEQLDELMLEAGGFEGNAQTLRILSVLEKKAKGIHSDDVGFANDKDERLGLNLTYRSLASVLKYHYCIPIHFKQREVDVENKKNPTGKIKPPKGFYHTEEALVRSIIDNVVGKGYSGAFKTVEMQIMDIADDIAYSTYDFEDSLKGGFIHLFDLIGSDRGLFAKIAETTSAKLNQRFTEKDVADVVLELFDDLIPDFNMQANLSKSNMHSLIDQVHGPTTISAIYHQMTKPYSQNGYYRAEMTSRLVDKFIRSVNITINKEHPALSKVFMDESCIEPDHQMRRVPLKVEVLKRFTYEFQISSNKLKIVEYRGKEIVKEIFNAIWNNQGKNGFDFLPYDFNQVCINIQKMNSSDAIKERLKMRTVCDFVASMTDRYAIEYYGRLKSESPQSIFKSI